MKKTIGILGGMGPLATADLYRKIVENTAAGRDADHIRVFIDSDPQVPDRSAAILSGGEDPVPEMLTALRHLEACGADCIIMPCNTAHHFLPALRAQTKIPFLDMPRIAAERCAGLFPGQTAAVLATDGTLSAGVYSDALSERGVPFLLPDERERRALMRLIYDVVKAARPLPPEEDAWRSLLDGLRARGADYFLLGCTELPLLADALPVPGPFLDATLELAKAAIRFCGGSVRL